MPAGASLVTALFLDGVPQTNQAAVTLAPHRAFLVLAAVRIVSSPSVWGLRRDDGASISSAVIAGAVPA